MIDMPVEENLKIFNILPIHATRGLYSENYCFELETILTRGVLKLTQFLTQSQPGKIVIRFSCESDIWIGDFNNSPLSTHRIDLVEKWSQIVIRPRLTSGYSFYHLNVFYFKKEDFFDISSFLKIIP